MNTLEYLMLGMSAISLVAAPFLLARAIRRRQYYRLFEIPLAASVVCYIAVSDVWPVAIQNAPPPVRWLAPVLFVLWIMDFVGLFRWLFNRCQRTQKI